MLARSVPAGDGTWARYYPTGSLFAQPVGYLIAAAGRAAGLERSRGDALRGLQTGLNSIFGQLSPHRVGDDVYTTLDPKAQQVALQQLDGQAGSVVALDPRTGAVKVMVAIPGYDDNHPDAPCTQPGCKLNRSTQGAVPARFDVQGRDRHRGDRQRSVHAELDGQRQVADHGLGRAAVQRQQPGLRHDRPDDGADVLGQHGVGAGRRARRARRR